jgi:hypothetical protein
MSWETAKTQWLQDNKGRDDSIHPGLNSEKTTDQSNTRYQFGHVYSRGGLNKFNAIATPSSAAIIGLGAYNREANATSNVITRMLPTAFEYYGAGAWNVVTGTALNGTTTTRPQFVNHKNNLIFTNEGKDQPRKFTSTLGNTATLGGTPPYCKTLVDYLSYLMLGNISGDGSFSDTAYGWYAIQYSDDFDNNWSLCSGNILYVNETPGSIVRLEKLGKSLIVYKDDGLVVLTWVGGQSQFQKYKLPTEVGCVAPLSVVNCADTGHYFLGFDGQIYNVTPYFHVRSISNAQLSETLPTTIGLNKLAYARGFSWPSKNLYILLYDRTGLSGQLLDSYIALNYRTGEFQSGQLGVQVIAGTNFRSTNLVDFQLLLSTTTLVEEFETGGATDDDGVATNRYHTTNWIKLDEEGNFYGLRIAVERSAYSRIAVSWAKDFDEKFVDLQNFSLKGGNLRDKITELQYKIQPSLCSWVRVKIEFFHDAANMTPQVERIGLVYEPIHTTPLQRSVPVARATGGYGGAQGQS